MKKIHGHPVLSRLIPWVLFWALFAWGWRVQNIFTHIPGYGDALEVLWGILWYYDSIFIRHASPFFTALVFHPLGWHTATLAHTPFLFLLTLPLFLVGGLAFAYNFLSVLSMVISFAGCFRLVRSFASSSTATVAALVYTFVDPHWFRLGGHLHTAWLLGLFPWMALAVERLGQSSAPQCEKRLVIAAGLIWGLAINFSLYGIFMGAIFFVLWGSRLLSLKRLLQVISAAVIAMTLSLISIVPYVISIRQDALHVHGVEHNLWWGGKSE